MCVHVLAAKAHTCVVAVGENGKQRDPTTIGDLVVFCYQWTYKFLCCIYLHECVRYLDSTCIFHDVRSSVYRRVAE